MREELQTSPSWLRISTRGIQHSHLSGSVFPLKGGNNGNHCFEPFSRRDWFLTGAELLGTGQMIGEPSIDEPLHAMTTTPLLKELITRVSSETP